MSNYAILFPGQGSQERGMGRDLAEAKPSLMQLWELAEHESGLPLRDIYWRDEAADMADTRALQPALTCANLCVWLSLKDRLRPAAAAGHSLGEFSALAAAGVLTPEAALRATAVRGRLMAQCGGPDQAMAAVVKLGQETVEAIVAQAAAETGLLLRIANYNSPAQFVVSGLRPAVERAGELAKEAKGRAVPLAVSGAFHSPLIQDAADEFRTCLHGLDWNAPAFPVYFDATAAPENDPAAIREIMGRQMTSSVLWIQIMDRLHTEAHITRFLELGPKTVLAKLAAANAPGTESQSVGSLDQVLALTV
ncbi:MAG: ACP S-malonyltransferase [Desulfovibrionaceae bacterium]